MKLRTLFALLPPFAFALAKPAVAGVFTNKFKAPVPSCLATAFLQLNTHYNPSVDPVFDQAERRAQSLEAQGNTAATKEARLELAEEYEKHRRPQEAIWTLEMADQPDMANALKAQLRQKLTQGRIVAVQRFREGNNYTTYLVRYDDGTLGVFKPMNYKKEVAMYLVDQMLDLRKVPMTVERQVTTPEGVLQGSVQYFVGGTSGYKYEKTVDADLRFFDFAADHVDRRYGRNTVIRPGGYDVAIDGGAAFGGMGGDQHSYDPLTYIHKIENLFGDRGLPLSYVMPSSPRLRAKYRALTEEGIRKELGGNLTRDQINAFIKRRDAFFKDLALD